MKPLRRGVAVVVVALSISACGDGDQASVPIEERRCPDAAPAVTAPVPAEVPVPEGARITVVDEVNEVVRVVAEVESSDVGAVLDELRRQMPPESVPVFEESEPYDAELSYRVGEDLVTMAMRVVCQDRIQYRVNVSPAPV